MKKGLFLAFGLLAASFSASATTITYTATVPLSTTNWNQNATIQMFDSSLGTLNSVKLTLAGNIVADIRIENEDPSATATVTSTASAVLSVFRPGLGGTVIVTINPNTTRTDNLSVYDNVTDYTGTSGRNYRNIGTDALGAITASGSNTVTLTGGSDLALFTTNGTNNIVLPWSSVNQTNVQSSGGDVNTRTATQAGSSLEVVYDYTSSAVPEPSSMALAGSALMVVGFLGRRFRK